ncbi:hypothetical protein SprV_0100269600 [Sparganum proliferum]
MHFRSRVSTTTLHELLLTGDCVLITTSEGDMQRSMNLFAAACNNVGLVINTEKTVVIYQPSPDAAYVTPQITTTPAAVSSPKCVSSFTPTNSIDRTPDPPLPSSSSSPYSSIASTSAKAAPVPLTTAHDPNMPKPPAI